MVTCLDFMRTPYTRNVALAVVSDVGRAVGISLGFAVGILLLSRNFFHSAIIRFVSLGSSPSSDVGCSVGPVGERDIG